LMSAAESVGAEIAAEIVEGTKAVKE